MVSEPDGLEQIDPPSTVLLLGSGFSSESTNILGETPPNGSGLRRYFLRKLKLPQETDYDLKTLADEFAARENNILYRELWNLFRIDKWGPSQEGVLRENWLRIYTTNYDDRCEVTRHHLGIRSESYVSTEQLPNKFSPNSIVHLHGSITKITEDGTLDDLVLGEGA